MVGNAALREPSFASEAPVNREFELSIKVFFSTRNREFSDKIL